MKNTEIKNYLLQKWHVVRASVGIPTLIIITLLASYLLYTVIRDWRIDYEIEKQNKRIEQYEKKATAAINNAEKHLAKFEQTHKTTLGLLDAVKDINDNVNRLADNDRIIEIRTHTIGEKYEKAKKQSNNSDNGRTNVPISKRESDALAADRELYPNK